MSNRSGGHAFKRSLTDDWLRERTVDDLYDFAAQCDVEPADESVCDACAAYIIAQEMEEAARKTCPTCGRPL